jgi:hypothetical protein
MIRFTINVYFIEEFARITDFYYSYTLVYLEILFVILS